MALKDLKSGTPKKKQGFEAGYGVMLEVATAVKNEDGTVKVTGKALNSSSFIKAGEAVTVELDAVGQDNMSRGGAKFSKPESSAGTVLTLEGCRQKAIDGDERVLTAKYVTTLKSNSKNYDMDRDFKSVVASAPVIAFKNVKPADGEPKYIKWATNTDSIRSATKNAKGERQVNEYGREWIAAKYADALAAGEKAHVYMDVVRPERAAQVLSEQDFYDLVRANSNIDRNMVLCVRAYDNEGAVMTRKIEQRTKKDDAGKYQIDTDGLIEGLKKGRVLRAIADNNKLFGEVKAGNVVMEVIPGNRMYFPGDSALTMIKKNLLSPAKDKEDNVVNTAAFIFGDKPYNYAKCLVPGLVGEDQRFMPINLVREEPGRMDLYTMTTPVTPTAPGTAMAAVPAAEDIHVDDEAMDQPLDANLFDEDLTPAASAPAPAM